MSRDIFTHFPRSPPSRICSASMAGSLSRAQNGGPSILTPTDPEMQRLLDAIDARRDAEIARRAVEMDTPENRQKASEAEAAERKRKRIDFHCIRAIPRNMPAGWKHIREDLADEELRVYTTDHKRRRFWGIKPAGIGMFDFWEQNDPEIERYEDNIAMTWANPLIPPPVTTYDENIVMIWAGKGSNPDLTPSEPPTAKAPPATKAAAKPRRGRESSYVNTTHRLRKSTAESSKVKKNTRKSVVHKVDAGHSEFEDQMQEVTEAAHASGNSRRPQGRRPANAKSVAQNNISSIPKRLRGRPSASTQPPANETDPIPSTRPRGRPPLKEKAIERPSKLKKKTPAIEGNARVTKSSQKKSRPSAPSTHKMRTRGEGPAELLQLQ